MIVVSWVPFLLVLIIIVAMVTQRSRRRRLPFAHVAKPDRTASDHTGTAGLGRSRATADPLRLKLDEWASVGLITADQSDAIFAAEHESAPAPPRVPLATEAVGYVGSALVLTAIGMIVGNNWDSLPAVAHIAVLAIPTAAVIAAGAIVLRSSDAAMQRLGSVLWALSVAGAAATTVVAVMEIVGDNDAPDRGMPLMVGSVAAAVAVVEWVRHRDFLQQAALFAGVMTMSVGVVEVFESTRSTFSSPVWSIPVLMVGALWTIGGVMDRIEPSDEACLLGPAALLVGLQIFAADQRAIGVWFGTAVVVGLLALGMLRDHPILLLVGTLGVFIWTPQLALYYLEDEVGPEATLMVLGLLLIGVAVMVTKYWRSRGGMWELHRSKVS